MNQQTEPKPIQPNSVRAVDDNSTATGVHDVYRPRTVILQRREQTNALHLLLDGYRPLAFLLQQGLHFITPLVALFGITVPSTALEIINDGAVSNREKRR
ncbi:MAG: hypothetical protein R2932_15350 [Caldilineaceae bacterium]